MKPCNHDDPSWCTDECEPSPREVLRKRIAELEATCAVWRERIEHTVRYARQESKALNEPAALNPFIHIETGLVHLLDSSDAGNPSPGSPIALAVADIAKFLGPT